MKKSTIVGLFLLLPLAIPPALAWAVNAHESTNDPFVCEEQPNGTVICSGTAVGLGNDAVVVQVDVAFACETRSGSNQPGGHIQDDTGPIEPDEGRVEFEVPVGPAKCPRGLNPVVGDTAILTILSEDEILLQQSVPIT
jgi:hypothetical protein